MRISRIVRDFDAVWSGVEGFKKEGLYDCQIYPVPASDRVFADLSGAVMAEPSFRLVDLQGREVFGYEGLHQNKFSNILSIDVSGLSSGIYWIIIKEGSKSIVKKIIVSR